MLALRSFYYTTQRLLGSDSENKVEDSVRYAIMLHQLDCFETFSKYKP